MKAVFSFWNTTGDALHSVTNWADPKFHLYSWILSVGQASKYFSDVELVTDSISLPMFQELNLPFTNIRTDLDELKGYSKKFWALGKIKAYQVQTKPFVHIDNDFICFNKPPQWFLDAPIGFQNRETGDWFEMAYRCQVDNLTINGKGLPKSCGKSQEAYNFGIYSCNDLKYNERYCKEVFELVDNNQELIVNTGHAGLYCVVFEQHIGSNVAYDMEIQPAFLSEFCDYKEIENLGLIHIWGAKRNQKWFESIEKIVSMEYPEHFKIVNNLIK